MKEQVRQILQRELEKLDKLSVESGLDLDDFRKLDLLLKAHRTCEAPDKPTSGSGDTEPEPSSLTDDQLLASIIEHQETDR